MIREQCRGLSTFDENPGRRAALKPRPVFDVDVSNGDERHAPRTHAAASRGMKGPCDSCAMWAHRGATSGTRLTEALTVAWEIVPLFRFYLSSRHVSPRRFSVTRALEIATAVCKSRLLFVSWKRGDSVMMGSMQVFVCKIVSRYVSILVSLHCDPWMVYNVVWTRWREFLMCNVKHLG